MRNPLLKRIPREIVGEFGKYLAIFLFMTVTIGFISGFLVASRSLQVAYDGSFEKYQIEDGHFVLEKEPSDKLLEKIEQEGVKLYEDLYLEEETFTGEKEERSVLRLYTERKEINRIFLWEGKLPEQTGEIALDRLYMKNNHLELGDTIKIVDRLFRITAMAALSDYSTTYQSNNDIMFDGTKFSVAIVTKEDFTSFGEDHLSWNYEWMYQEKPKDTEEEKEVSSDLSMEIAKAAMDDENELKIFLPRYINNSIQFAGNDIGHDRPMMTVLLYILIAIMAFVFAVTINHTVSQESAVIGTLRASGYTKMEIFRHYLAPPMFVSMLAAVLGNVLGYTKFYDVAANMYLGSYDVPLNEIIFNSEVFIKTTIVPMVIILMVTGISLWKKLEFSPLQFLRRDIVKRKRSKAVKLPRLKFFSRFRLRIILQNMSGYLTLFIGIIFSSLILMFGMVMRPLLSRYAEDALNYKPANYQYILNQEQEIEEPSAEKYCVTALKMQDDYYEEEDINIYGIVEDSKYYSQLDLPEYGVLVTSDMAKKYHLKKGSIVNLKEEYGNEIYAFRVQGIFEYPTCLGLFMSQEYFCDVFQKEIEKNDDVMKRLGRMLTDFSGTEGELYYNGYFSENDLSGILREDNIASVITDDDLTKLSRQMDISMGEMFGMVGVFALVLFALLIYLLTKLILEKNTNSISMVKILGYTNGEIGSLYLVSSIWVVILSAIIALIFNTWFFSLVLIIFMKGYGGWFNLIIGWELYLEMFVMMVGTYLLVALTQMLRIKKIPMEEALKNVE